MNNCSESIGFSHAEKYCKMCGLKESYNGNRPLSAPIKCKYCGGEMTDENTEKFLIKLDQDISNYIEKIKKDRTEYD